MTIKSNLRDYTVRFVETDELLQNLSYFSNPCFVIDETVWNLYRDSLLRPLMSQDVVPVVINEENKCLEGVELLYDHLVTLPTKKNTTMVSIGGGILQDISGFAASTLYRGINWVFLPTTLLAQSDSCIGSKTSLNFKGFKNLIGTFYPPSEVIIHVPFTKTQNELDFFSGLGEVTKLHLIGGEKSVKNIIRMLPALMRGEPSAVQDAVVNALTIKQAFITEDEFDSGRRNLLNYGHCFGHAIEATSQFEIPHGQAVVLGMILANIVSRKRNTLSDALFNEVSSQILNPCLKIRPNPNHILSNSIINAMKKDKKRTGEGLALVMMSEGFSFTRVNDLSVEEVEFAVEEYRSRYEAS